jgi:tetratricopeptide (TPR) repeat protein
LKRPRTNLKSGHRKDLQVGPKGFNRAQPIPKPPSRARKWFFRTSAALLPVLALVVVELALRLGGYGYSSGFFKPLRVGNQPLLVENDAFGFRFFPRDLARMPLSLRMPAKKPPETYRLFILGESAAMGDPEPAFGAGRYLETLLRERFPNAKFEVVNVAMTAINSHAILPIARDCARREGDLWILYIGNNEMVGPFGAATVFGLKAPPLALVRWYLACQKLRAGQLILDLSRRFQGSARANSWGGMKMFLGNQIAPEARAREAVYRNFHKNLEDIVQAGLDSGATVLLSTVAVNLKHCPPFASMHSANASSADRAACETSYREGCLADQHANSAQAAQHFERAAKFDPGMAEVQYRWGEALLKSANFGAAREHFQRACDDDALPFRATSRINELIRQVGRQFAGANIDCFDVVPVLETNTSEGLCGQETFYEHVHFNFEGNYRLARAWAGKVEMFLPASLRSGATAAWASQDKCELRLGLTDWDRYHVLEEVIGRRQRPPLNAQFNNGQLLRALSDQAAELKRGMDSGTARMKARDIYVEALRRAPEDYFILQNFAEFLQDTGEIKPAIEQWQQVRELIPQDHEPLYQLGRLAAVQGQYAQAKKLLGETVAMRPSFAPGWFELGSVHAAATNYDLAVAAFDRALRFEPENAKYWLYDGLALAMVGRRSEAIEHYRQAVRLDPRDWKAHFELGGLLGQDGNMSEARAESEASVRLNPAFPTSHLNLGLALAKLGSLDEAERQFEETLRLDPGNSRASDYLAQVRALKKDKQKKLPRGVGGEARKPAD